MTYKETKKAYEEIIDVISKYKDLVNFDYNDLERKSKYHLFGIELKEQYGLNIEPKDIYSLDWNKFGEYMSIGLFGEKYRRTISWSDDGKQPEDELLLQLSFSTGAYIFGEDYPQEFFQRFFKELKSYNPKYSDTNNKNLYFTLDSAKTIFNEFPEILKKYRQENKEDFKRRQIEKLQKELDKLNS